MNAGWGNKAEVESLEGDSQADTNSLVSAGELCFWVAKLEAGVLWKRVYE